MPCRLRPTPYSRPAKFATEAYFRQNHPAELAAFARRSTGQTVPSFAGGAAGIKWLFDHKEKLWPLAPGDTYPAKCHFHKEQTTEMGWVDGEFKKTFYNAFRAPFEPRPAYTRLLAVDVLPPSLTGANGTLTAVFSHATKDVHSKDAHRNAYKIYEGGVEGAEKLIQLAINNRNFGFTHTVVVTRDAKQIPDGATTVNEVLNANYGTYLHRFLTTDVDDAYPNHPLFPTVWRPLLRTLVAPNDSVFFHFVSPGTCPFTFRTLASFAAFYARTTGGNGDNIAFTFGLIHSSVVPGVFNLNKTFQDQIVYCTFGELAHLQNNHQGDWPPEENDIIAMGMSPARAHVLAGVGELIGQPDRKSLSEMDKGLAFAGGYPGAGL